MRALVSSGYLLCRGKKGGGEWMRKERGEVRMSNGEGWDDRKEGTVMELV